MSIIRRGIRLIGEQGIWQLVINGFAMMLVWSELTGRKAAVKRALLIGAILTIFYYLLYILLAWRVLPSKDEEEIVNFGDSWNLGEWDYSQ